MAAGDNGPASGSFALRNNSRAQMRSELHCWEYLSFGYNVHRGLRGQSEGAKACSSPALHGPGPWVIVVQPTQTSGRKVKSNHRVGFQQHLASVLPPWGARAAYGRKGEVGWAGCQQEGLSQFPWQIMGFPGLWLQGSPILSCPPPNGAQTALLSWEVDNGVFRWNEKTLMKLDFDL